MNLISEIKNRISIVELINRLGLRTNSSGFIKSIYKEEKNPSLKIYPKTNSYYCFATGQGGDVIKFYADYYKISVKEAIKELASMCGINPYFVVPNRERFQFLSEDYSIEKLQLLKSEQILFEGIKQKLKSETNLKDEDIQKLSFEFILETRSALQRKVFTGLYNFSISEGFDAQAMDYLTSKKRGLTEESIKKFKLFTIKSVTRTIEFLRDNYDRESLILSGLFSKKYFLFTRHRIVIPYIENDEIVYLRGRYFFEGKSEPENFGKYIGCKNGSLTLSPKRFYNIDLLKKLRPYEPLLITEGEFDCIRANQEGINSIGVPGVTNFPKDKINLIRIYDLYLAFDNDEAGTKAINEIAELIDRPLQVIRFKDHKDLSEVLNEQ